MGKLSLDGCYGKPKRSNKEECIKCSLLVQCCFERKRKKHNTFHPTWCDCSLGASD